ncbi:MAG: ferredoxin--NADP reductase [Bacteroidetes bacterium QH_2_64_74]|nr:MAG: ferredoxin--NADP reductase [Bacteroidetes bacterium QH_2_64_74]
MDTSQYSRLTLLERIDFSEELAVFRVRADEPVDFTPGQYATLGLMNDDDDRPLLRPYSVASPPGETELEFFIERVDEGVLTEKLWALEQGAELWMRDKIVGRFTLDPEFRYHLMVATVTGVGPYVSIVRDQLRALRAGTLDAPRPMLVVHGASRSWELGTYLDELTSLADEVDWFEYVPTVSRPWEDPDWDGELGRVEDVLRKCLDASSFDPGDTAAYTCGHPQMIENAQGILRRAGFEDDAIHEEKYFVEPNGT